MLVSLEWLKERDDAIIIDSRPKISYNYGHLKNSISLGVEQLIKVDQYGSNLVGDPDTLSKVLGDLGIDQSKTLIVLGEPMDPSAARIFWTLLYLGLEPLLLKEGFGLIPKSDLVRTQFKFTPTTFIPKINNIRITGDHLKENLGRFKLYDARSPQEFVRGNIPGSTLAPFTDGIGHNGELFLTKEKLSSMFPDKSETVCYCMHGHRAANLFCQLRIAGHTNVKLYDGSFIEWSKRFYQLSS